MTLDDAAARIDNAREQTLDTGQVNALLLEVEQLIGRRPEQVVGPDLRVRWINSGHDGESQQLLEVRPRPAVKDGTVQWTVTAVLHQDLQLLEREHLDIAYSIDPDIASPRPYLWNLLVTDFPSWRQEGIYPLTGWDSIRDQVVPMVAQLPLELSALPAPWCDAPVVVEETYMDSLQLAITRDGLRAMFRSSPERSTLLAFDRVTSLDIARDLFTAWADMFSAGYPLRQVDLHSAARRGVATFAGLMVEADEDGEDGKPVDFGASPENTVDDIHDRLRRAATWHGEIDTPADPSFDVFPADQPRSEAAGSAQSPAQPPVGVGPRTPSPAGPPPDLGPAPRDTIRARIRDLDGALTEPLEFKVAEPAREVWVFRAQRPVPHWHYLTWGGFIELGQELELRLADPSAEDPDGVPPRWPVDHLAGEIRWALDNSRFHELLTVKLDLGEGTTITDGGYLPDPDLPWLSFYRKRVGLWQVIGLTGEERRLTDLWRASGVVPMVAARTRGGILDPRRDSVVDDELRAEVNEGIRHEGSATQSRTDQLFSLDADASTVALDTNALACLQTYLPLRIPFGGTFTLRRDGMSLEFQPATDANADQLRARFTADTATIICDDALLAELGSMSPMAGFVTHLGRLPEVAWRLTEPGGIPLSRLVPEHAARAAGGRPVRVGTPGVDEVLAFPQLEPEPHWLLVTNALAERHGQELTMRLADPAALEPDAQPPAWATSLLLSELRYLREASNPFTTTSYTTGRAPWAGRLQELLWRRDPDLPRLRSMAGNCDFLQAVGLTAGDQARGDIWMVEPLAELVASRSPRGIIDPQMSSPFEDPDFSRRVEEGSRRDGSDRGRILTDRLQVVPDENLVVVRSADLELVQAYLPLRIPHGRFLTLSGKGAFVNFLPPAPDRKPIFIDEAGLSLVCDEQVLAELGHAPTTSGSSFRLAGAPQLRWVVTENPDELPPESATVLVEAGVSGVREEEPGETVDGPPPGWAAVHDAGTRAHPDQPEPLHHADSLPPELGGPPLPGVSVYRDLAPVPHWHYMGFGLSDVFGTGPVEDPQDDSGFGIELTFRLADPAAADPHAMPPTWPLSLMMQLASYVRETGNVLAPNQYMDTHGPIELGSDTQLKALGFRLDPELGEIETPRGHVRFVQLVGITLDELEAMSTWWASEMLDVLDEVHPSGVTDLTRRSVLDDPAIRERVEQGIARDGSSSRLLFVEDLDWTFDPDGNWLQLGASSVETVRRMLQGRLAFGRPLSLVARDRTLELVPGDDGVDLEGSNERLTLVLGPEVVEDLVAIVQPLRGTYRVPRLEQLLEVRVVPSEIRSANGDIVEVIG